MSIIQFCLKQKSFEYLVYNIVDEIFMSEIKIESTNNKKTVCISTAVRIVMFITDISISSWN